MTTWQYRIVKVVTAGNTWYGLFEVYNNNAGLPFMRTTEPTSFGGDEGHEVIEALQMAMNDALKYDILDDEDIIEENEDGFFDKERRHE